MINKTVELYYEKKGNGAPIVFLHGNGEDHTIFNELSSHLENHFTLYLFDSRDHGKSPITGDIQYDLMARDIELFIKKHIKEPVTIIGFSDGAIIATLIALDNPTVLKQIILLGFNRHPDDFDDKSKAFLEDLYLNKPSKLVELMLSQPNISLDQLSSIKTPTRLIWGEHDLFKQSAINDIVQEMPQAKTIILPNQTHDSYINHSDMLYPLLIEQLIK